MPLRNEMPTVVWNIQYSAPPAVARYCKRCGEKREHVCSGEFRVNAQQRALDVWLIYKCTKCHMTWNCSIASRVSPQKLGTALLERFHSNDQALAMGYAMDVSLLRRNGVEVKTPAYEIVGEDVSLERTVRVSIQSQFAFPLKISSVLREKLGVSQREFDMLLSEERIRCDTGQDLKKGRLSSPETVVTILGPRE